MKTLLIAATLAFAAAAPALAQHAGHGTAKPNAAAATDAAELADGEVRRIDKARGTVMLKHGDIRSIRMGPMTMNFRLKDPAMADTLKVGDKIKFSAEMKGDDLIVTSIRKAP